MRRTEAEVYRSALGKHGRWGFLVLVALLHACTSSSPTLPPMDGARQAPGGNDVTPLRTRTQSLGQLEAILHRGERALTAGDLKAASAAEAQIGADLKLRAEASTLSPALALRWARLRSALAFTQGDTPQRGAPLQAKSLAPLDQAPLVDEAFDRLVASLPPPALPPGTTDHVEPYHDLAQALAACAPLPARLPRAVAAWQARWPGTALPSLLKNLPPPAEESAPLRIAVLLPFTGPLQGAAEALRDGLLAAQFEAQRQGHEGSRSASLIPVPQASQQPTVKRSFFSPTSSWAPLRGTQ